MFNPLEPIILFFGYFTKKDWTLVDCWRGRTAESWEKKKRKEKLLGLNLNPRYSTVCGNRNDVNPDYLHTPLQKSTIKHGNVMIIEIETNIIYFCFPTSCFLQKEKCSQQYKQCVFFSLKETISKLFDLTTISNVTRFFFNTQSYCYFFAF